MILRYFLLALLVTGLLACVPDPKATMNNPQANPQLSSQNKAQSASSPARTEKLSTTAPATKPAAQTLSNSQTQTSAQPSASGIKVNPESPAYKQAAKPATRPVLGTNDQTTQNKSPNAKMSGSKLPSACGMVSESFLGGVIGVDADYIATKNGSGKSTTQNSCFFRWDQDGLANQGVLVQIQSNPLPDEFPDWASYYISAKRNQGDKSPDGASTFRYKDFKGYGVAGAYNYDLARYYWRTETDHVFLIAFNIQSTAEEQLQWANKIATEVMKNVKL